MTAESDLAALTGLRSGKSSFYPQYRGAQERAERVLHALDLIAGALVRTVDGPETVVSSAAQAAREHLQADWVVFALTEGSLAAAGLRRLVLGPDGIPFLVGRVTGPPLPYEVTECLERIRNADTVTGESVLQGRHAYVPLVLDGTVVGAIAAWTPVGRELDGTDAAVLNILASQTAVALHNASLYEGITTLLDRSEQAHAQLRRTAADLAVRNAELTGMQRELGAVQRHRALDDERHRIARELHDSVTQAVLSAGMQIEVCRSEIPDAERAERLDLAKEMTRRAVEQLRSAIYTLNNSSDRHTDGLPEMLRQLGVVHEPDELKVAVRVRGEIRELSAAVEHALLRIAGEALFNVAVHAGAERATVTLRYGSGHVDLAVDDDGAGDPAVLRERLRTSLGRDVDGHGRGLANMADRAAECGGSLAIRRSRLHGIRIQVTLPVEEAS
ncbi:MULTISPECIES: MadS family sensor histidine kinase [Tsukamurella]|uniref:Sensor histidine kinase n=2 Tax=Tsukamurella TaxID=2060 RepID=A0A846X418_9ACTN|nr:MULTISPECIES: histidine kinase [Tsukamurella]KXP03169.1 histidine kinase [Tsukamurella pseudospumae]NKY20124.1 sensor histidine kinase [Tsukamurella spumae]